MIFSQFWHDPQSSRKAKNISIICLKSFGDLVILRWAVRRNPSADVSILIGDHLAELNYALGPQNTVGIINHGEGRVPAIYDIRKYGLVNALASAKTLRRLLLSVSAQDSRTLVFDKVGIRERFMCPEASLRSLPIAANIYSAYEILLGSHDSNWHSPLFEDNISPNIGIFPGSRIARKIIPPKVIDRLIILCRRHNLMPTIYYLEGESESLVHNVDAESIIVPRRFSAMADAVHHVSAVISADSMPAHMAEYFGRPVYVLSPIPNMYWLPLTAYKLGRWACIADNIAIETSLSGFLEQIGL